MLSDLQAVPHERAAHIPHGLHTGTRLWVPANPYVSLWVEVLHAWGLEPLAILYSALPLRFDADQFALLSLPFEALQELYGVSVFRIAVYDRLEAHIASQTQSGNVVFANVDAFHLPDLASLYGVRHGQTAVAIDRLDPSGCSASYYRQGKRFELTDGDYRGIFYGDHSIDGFNDALIQHMECIHRTSLHVAPEALAWVSLQKLRQHVGRLSEKNPITAFREAFHDSLETLSANGEDYRHAFVFGTLSQLGSRFELLSAYLSWLHESQQVQSKSASQACRKIVSESLVCQLRLLRASSRGQIDACEDGLNRIQKNFDLLVEALLRY